jgi:hypothetical protein
MDNSNTFFNKINYSVIFCEVYNIVKQYKYLLFFIFFIFLWIILMIVAFIIIKILKISLDRIIFFYDYNKLCKKKLEKYGKCEINKIYLIRNHMTKFHIFLINLVTLFQYDKIVNQFEENYPYHTSMLLEIKLEDNKIKWLILEKNNCITMNDNFILTQGMEMEEVELNKEKKIYLEEFLEETRNRMGDEKFFNWNVFKNNCQEFTKELMITTGKYDDYYKNIICTNKIFGLVQPSEFVYCMFNFLFIIYNFLEKYIFELDLFN